MSFQLKAKEFVLKSLTDGTGYHLATFIPRHIPLSI
jgi:hypothetical protein